jgi:hypothetical protein
MVGAALVVAVGMAGCTHSDPAPNRSTVTPSLGSTALSASASPTPSPMPSATPSPSSVPIDQIPPGRPASWVPAGVPATAKWREPGDVVPMFTLAMFINDENGALAAAHAYLAGLNWAIATLDPRSFLAICDAAQCKTNAKINQDMKASGQHFEGGRGIFESPTLFAAPKASGAQWIVRVQASLYSGKVVDSNGKVVEQQSASKERLDVYTRWNGKMWRISDVFLAS